MTELPPSRAVYTALIGGYERLQEQPAARGSSIPFICLTDDPDLTSETWDVRLVEPALVRDPVRSARFAKILGDPVVAEYDETLWIDNKILLTADPGTVLDDLLGDADLAVIQHSYRSSLTAEFDEVARVGLDEPARIYEQLIHYAETKPHVLDQTPYWSAVLARRRTPQVDSAMRAWMNHVLRYSRRDQLSLPYVLDGLGRVRVLELDNYGSQWHSWNTDHAGLQLNGASRSNAYRTSIRAPLANVASLSDEVAALRSELAAEQERSRAALAEVARLRDRVSELRDRLKRLRTRVRRLREKLAVERERSAMGAAGQVRRLLTRGNSGPGTRR